MPEQSKIKALYHQTRPRFLTRIRAAIFERGQNPGNELAALNASEKNDGGNTESSFKQLGVSVSRLVLNRNWPKYSVALQTVALLSDVFQIDANLWEIKGHLKVSRVRAINVNHHPHQLMSPLPSPPPSGKNRYCWSRPGLRIDL